MKLHPEIADCYMILDESEDDCLDDSENVNLTRDGGLTYLHMKGPQAHAMELYDTLLEHRGRLLDGEYDDGAHPIISEIMEEMKDLITRIEKDSLESWKEGS